MPTQSKKGKDRQRTRRVEEEPDEEMVDGGDEQEAHDSDAEAGGDGGGWTLEPTAHIEVSNHAKKAAKDLGQRQGPYVREICRLALACEYKRVALKREDINQKVFTKEGQRDKLAMRAFPYLFRKAQRQLRKVFGYAMVEIRPRGHINELLKAQNTQLASKNDSGSSRAAKSTDDQANVKSGIGNAWVLCSVLPYEIRSAMLDENMKLQNTQMDGAAASALGGMREPDMNGIMVDWRRADGQLGSMGILHVILGLILASGRELDDSRLRGYLNRLGLVQDTILPRRLRPDDTVGRENATHVQPANPIRKTENSAHSVSDWLDLMIKQQYLEIVSTAPDAGKPKASGGTQRNKRTSRKSGNAEAANMIAWKWGGRAEVEIGEHKIAAFVIEITAATSADFKDENAKPEEEGRRSGRDASQKTKKQANKEDKEREKMIKNLERAVGSQLVN